MTTERTPLDAVRIFAANRKEADEKLFAVIRDAREKGESLRAIAEAAGLSHQTIQNIVSRDEAV